MGTHGYASVSLDDDATYKFNEGGGGRWMVSAGGAHLPALSLHGTPAQLRAMAQQILDEVPAPIDTPEWRAAVDEGLTPAQRGQVEAVAGMSDSMAFGEQV